MKSKTLAGLKLLGPAVLGAGLLSLSTGTAAASFFDAQGGLQVTNGSFQGTGSTIYDNGELHVATDNYLYLDAPVLTTVSKDLGVQGGLNLYNGGFHGTGSKIFDNAELHIATDNYLYLDAPVLTTIQGGLTVNGSTTLNALTAGAVTGTSFTGNGASLTNLAGGNVTGNISGNAANVTGVVAVANGGTGASTAAGARTNLGAAASGANSDITSLGGLTTALSVAQGGTGSTTQNFVDLTTAQTVAGSKTFSSATTHNAAVSVNGSADAVQLTVKGNATQTNNILALQNSVSTNLLTVANSGNIAATGTLTGLTGLTVASGGATITAGGLTVSAGGITNTGTLSSTGASTFTANAATTVPVSIVGAASQSGDYLDLTANGGAAGGVLKVASNGNITASGSLTGLTGLTVASGGATITAGGLTVSAGGITVNGGDLTLAGGATPEHIISTQTTAPTAAASVTGLTAASVAGTDTKGTVTTTGTPSAAGTITTTFNRAYGTAPVVVITPANASAQAANAYVSSSTTTTFVITTTVAAPGATPSWNYVVIQ